MEPHCHHQKTRVYFHVCLSTFKIINNNKTRLKRCAMCIVRVSTIPHICHGHHGRCSCKKILSSVKFSKVEGKETDLILHKICTHCSKTKFNPNVPQLTSFLQIIIPYICTCHFEKKLKYFTESISRYCPCTLGACVHAHLEKFLDFSFQLA